MVCIRPWERKGKVAFVKSFLFREWDALFEVVNGQDWKEVLARIQFGRRTKNILILFQSEIIATLF
jgi:hypothetical protein